MCIERDFYLLFGRLRWRSRPYLAWASRERFSTANYDGNIIILGWDMFELFDEREPVPILTCRELNIFAYVLVFDGTFAGTLERVGV